MLGLLVIGCGFRVWVVFRFNPMESLWSDPGRHWLSGTHPLDTAPMSAIDPIAYQLYLGTLAKLASGQLQLVAYWTALPALPLLCAHELWPLCELWRIPVLRKTIGRRSPTPRPHSQKKALPDSRSHPEWGVPGSGGQDVGFARQDASTQAPLFT